MGATERWSRDDGFTLLELVIVTIIIGILATIAIGVFFTQREKAERSVAKSAIRNAVTYAEIVRDGSQYSDDVNAYAAEAPSSLMFTNGASEGPQELSLKAFEGGDMLVIASQARGTCLYLRLQLEGETDVRGHHDDPECHADALQAAPGNGWP